jgi:bacteriochlorophyllide a dehydrogenase
VSGDPGVLDRLLEHSAPRAEIVLAGFYSGRIGFDFVPAFLRESRIRVAAQWGAEDLRVVAGLLASGAIVVSDLVTHRASPASAGEAYRTAFSDPGCIKLIFDWSQCA